MKTNKKVQTNSVQKSEKENAVKVTALAIIPKPMTLLTPQDVPTATEVTEAPETATIPTVTEEASQQATFKTPLATATAETDLDITTIHPSTDNHRKTFNDASLQELAESIREVGILQAIAVRPRTEGGYEIIYGERRYRASLLAGAKTIKATIYNNVTDDEAEDMSLSENLQREQVRPTEEAKAFKRLLEKGRYDMYSLTARFGRSEKYIYTRLKLNELYAPVGELLDNETITVSVAEEISTYEPDIQKDVYEKHLKEGNGEDWTGYTLNLFKRYFEKYYTTDLGQYKFDKTECNGHGDNNASKLLRDFANMHFPDQYGLVKATHEEEYQKRHERLEERIKEMKKAEKKAAREAEKQQTTEKTEKKTTAPKTEKPESGKAA